MRGEVLRVTGARGTLPRVMLLGGVTLGGVTSLAGLWDSPRGRLSALLDALVSGVCGAGTSSSDDDSPSELELELLESFSELSGVGGFLRFVAGAFVLAAFTGVGGSTMGCGGGMMLGSVAQA